MFRAFTTLFTHCLAVIIKQTYLDEQSEGYDG